MFFKGINQVFNSLGGASAATADLVESVVELGKDNVTNSREMTAIEHLVELSKASKKVKESDAIDALAKVQLLTKARKKAVETKEEEDDA